MIRIRLLGSRALILASRRRSVADGAGGSRMAIPVSAPLLGLSREIAGAETPARTHAGPPARCFPALLVLVRRQ